MQATLRSKTAADSQRAEEAVAAAAQLRAGASESAASTAECRTRLDALQSLFTSLTKSEAECSKDRDGLLRDEATTRQVVGKLRQAARSNRLEAKSRAEAVVAVANSVRMSLQEASKAFDAWDAAGAAAALSAASSAVESLIHPSDGDDDGEMMDAEAGARRRGAEAGEAGGDEVGPRSTIDSVLRRQRRQQRWRTIARDGGAAGYNPQVRATTNRHFRRQKT